MLADDQDFPRVYLLFAIPAMIVIAAVAVGAFVSLFAS